VFRHQWVCIHGRRDGKCSRVLPEKRRQGANAHTKSSTSLEPIAPVFLCGLMRVKRERHSVWPPAFTTLAHNHPLQERFLPSILCKLECWDLHPDALSLEGGRGRPTV